MNGISKILFAVFALSMICTVGYAVWGYYTVEYQYDLSMGQDLTNLLHASDFTTMQQLTDKVLANDLWNHPNAPVGLLEALRPTQDTTAYKYHLRLEGLKSRVDQDVLFQERQLGDQSQLPYLDQNRYTSGDFEKINDYMATYINVGIKNAWIYTYYPWYFWYGPFTVLLLVDLPLIAAALLFMAFPVIRPNHG